MAVIFILTGKIESSYLIVIIIALCIINKLDIVTGCLTFHQNYQPIYYLHCIGIEDFEALVSVKRNEKVTLKNVL